MKTFVLEPEVAGGLGPLTDLDTTLHPPIIFKLHYVFDDWLGDSLVASFPCFICTSDLASAVKDAGLIGVEFDIVLCSKSELFDDLNGDLDLPEFEWMKICGQRAIDDFALSPQGHLVVSEKALGVLQRGSLKNCKITPWTTK
jgi:hypothetical protein